MNEYYKEHKEELLLRQRERYYNKKNGGTDCITPYKVKKRLENQEKNYITWVLVHLLIMNY